MECVSIQFHSPPLNQIPPAPLSLANTMFSVQGAAEIVLARCVNVVDMSGRAVPLTETLHADLNEVITSMAQRGLRTLCLAYADLDINMDPKDYAEAPDNDLTIICIVGIKVRRWVVCKGVCWGAVNEDADFCPKTICMATPGLR